MSNNLHIFILLPIFTAHIEPLESGNLSKLNLFFGPKGVQIREVTLYTLHKR